MQKRYHFLRITTFVQATEDADKVKQAMENLIGEGLPEGIKELPLEGVHHNPITYLSLELIRARDIRRILARWEDMDFWTRAKEQIEERLDGDLTYHVRVDKMEAFKGFPELWKGGEAIEVQLKAATYPASREGAMNIILEGPL